MLSVARMVLAGIGVLAIGGALLVFFLAVTSFATGRPLTSSTELTIAIYSLAVVDLGAGILFIKVALKSR